MARALHIMLDLKTRGTQPGCQILSIGAQVFDPRGEGLGGFELGLEHFHGTSMHALYMTLQIVPQAEAGLTTAPQTDAWWDRQDPLLRAEAYSERVDPLRAVLTLEQWILNLRYAAGLVGHDTDGLFLWAHGKEFDPAILEEARQRLRAAVDLPAGGPLWDFRNLLDTRTMLWASGLGMGSVSPEQGYRRHHALAEARQQARAMQRALANLQGAEVQVAAPGTGGDLAAGSIDG